MIDPSAVAFDIDSVVADTMSLFIDIARDEFNINGIQYSDFTSYFLEECIDVDEYHCRHHPKTSGRQL